MSRSRGTCSSRPFIQWFLGTFSDLAPKFASFFSAPLQYLIFLFQIYNNLRSTLLLETDFGRFRAGHVLISKEIVFNSRYSFPLSVFPLHCFLSPLKFLSFYDRSAMNWCPCFQWGAILGPKTRRRPPPSRIVSASAVHFLPFLFLSSSFKPKPPPILIF